MNETTATQATPRAIAVTITGGSKPTVEPETVTLEHPQDEVEWVCAEDFVVSFGADTPFRKRYFHEGRPKSGQPRSDAKKETKYKYSVLVGGHVIDPNIIIK